MRSYVLLAVLAAWSAADARAQEDASSDHYRAAAAVVELLQMERTLASSIEVMTDAMVNQNTMLAPLRDVFIGFFGEFMRWDELRPKYIRLYTEAFSEAELLELRSFYQTPLGQKLVEVTPLLMRRGTELGQEQIQPHLAELQRRIQARIGGGSSGGV